jgi:hypothetical protein
VRARRGQRAVPRTMQLWQRSRGRWSGTL